MKLFALAPGKVNLCLYLGGLRDDGRHEVVTLIESVSLADEVMLESSTDDQVVCPGVEEPNIVTDALRRLREVGWTGPPVRIEITKQVPVAAGMGGGSADAAALLRLAHQIAPIPADTVSLLAEKVEAAAPEVDP